MHVLPSSQELKHNGPLNHAKYCSYMYCQQTSCNSFGAARKPLDLHKTLLLDAGILPHPSKSIETQAKNFKPLQVQAGSTPAPLDSEAQRALEETYLRGQHTGREADEQVSPPTHQRVRGGQHCYVSLDEGGGNSGLIRPTRGKFIVENSCSKVSDCVRGFILYP